jgi:hypothetical protein
MHMTYKIDDPDSIATTYYIVVVSYTWERARRHTMSEPGCDAHAADVEIESVAAIMVNGVRFVPTGDTSALVARLSEYCDHGELVDAVCDHEYAMQEAAAEWKAEQGRYG